MRFDPRLAPVKAAVLPAVAQRRSVPKAKALATSLRQRWNVEFDDAGAIGRRYRRQDEIGTPFCLTVDFDSLDDNAVTVRNATRWRRSGSGSMRWKVGWRNDCRAADAGQPIPGPLRRHPGTGC